MKCQYALVRSIDRESFITSFLKGVDNYSGSVGEESRDKLAFGGYIWVNARLCKPPRPEVQQICRWGNQGPYTSGSLQDHMVIAELDSNLFLLDSKTILSRERESRKTT